MINNKIKRSWRCYKITYKNGKKKDRVDIQIIILVPKTQVPTSQSIVSNVQSPIIILKKKIWNLKRLYVGCKIFKSNL